MNFLMTKIIFKPKLQNFNYNFKNNSIRTIFTEIVNNLFYKNLFVEFLFNIYPDLGKSNLITLFFYNCKKEKKLLLKKKFHGREND